jgi:hypothetical protein
MGMCVRSESDEHERLLYEATDMQPPTSHLSRPFVSLSVVLTRG